MIIGYARVSTDDQNLNGQLEALKAAGPRCDYVARIELQSPEIIINNRTLRLEPDMTVRAEIHIESRSVIDYVLSPVSQVLKETGHER